MRILRLFAPSLIGDHTLCYVHTNSAGQNCINEVPLKIKYALAGADLSGSDSEDAMYLVLPVGTIINNGDFLAVGEGETLLRLNQQEQQFDVITPGFLSVSASVQIWRTLRTAILTVSDKGSRGDRVDTAGPELERLITALGGTVEDRKIVPDEFDVIADSVKKWCDQGYNLVLTTGGTGLSQRDVTPEALMSIADKVVPGFGEMMRIQTLVHTPRAFLTRSLAVIRKQTLVIAFPGSQRGARQCFESISSALRHGAETLSGWDGECGNHKHGRKI